MNGDEVAQKLFGFNYTQHVLPDYDYATMFYLC